MAFRKYNRFVDGGRNPKESEVPSGKYISEFVDYINNMGGDGTLTFDDATAQDEYLSTPDADKKAGQLAVVLTVPGQIYQLSANKSTWIPTTVDVNVEPGGATTQIQFNDVGDFGGDAKLTWNKTNFTLGINGVAVYASAPSVLSTALTLAHRGYVDDLVQNTLQIIGNWDADADDPDITTVDPSPGDVYIVSVDGETSLGGITGWKVGDWAIKATAAGAWARIPANTVSLEISAIPGLQGELDARPTRNTIEVINSDGEISIDFEDKNECFATKVDGGALVINTTSALIYENDDNFTTLYLPIEVTLDEQVVTFPVDHKSADERWTPQDEENPPYLTLAEGFYQISVVFNGVYYSVVCSQTEV